MNTVLIADDSSFMRTIIRRILEKEGFTVVGEAENGIVCVEKYRERRPDIVTLDITMSTLDGIQTLKALMAIDPKAKVVMVSSMGQESLVEEALSAGAKEYIMKPFTQDRFVLVLKRIVEY